MKNLKNEELLTLLKNIQMINKLISESPSQY